MANLKCSRSLSQLSSIFQVQSAQQTEVVAQRLITTKARKLQDVLVKETREAYANYDDAQLATLLANKRLNDYKQALIFIIRR
jgi:glutamate synthase (NADPH/NADH) large chain